MNVAGNLLFLITVLLATSGWSLIFRDALAGLLLFLFQIFAIELAIWLAESVSGWKILPFFPHITFAVSVAVFCAGVFRFLSSPIRFSNSPKAQFDRKPDPIPPELTALSLVFFGFVLLKIFFASAFYPVRGIDDIDYHFPQTFAKFEHGKFVVLSAEIDPRFAFPKSAYPIRDLYVFFTGEAVFVEFTNVVWLILLWLSVARMLDRFGRNTRFFVATAVAGMPVCIAQSSSGYVDTAFAGLFASSVALARFPALSAISAGLFLGTKYTSLVLFPFLAFRVMREKGVRGAVLFALISLAVGSVWYIDNLARYGFPIWPPPSHKVYPQPPREISLKLLRNLVAFAKYDLLEMSFHKGLGPVFWLFVLPIFLLSVRRKPAEAVLFVLPALWMLWRNLTSLHVNGRFFIWLVPAMLSVSDAKGKAFVVLAVISQIANMLTVPLKVPKTSWPILTTNLPEVKKECATREFVFFKVAQNFNLWYIDIPEAYAVLSFLPPSSVAVSYGDGELCKAFGWEDSLENCTCFCPEPPRLVLFLEHKLLKVKVEDVLENPERFFRSLGLEADDFDVLWRSDDIVVFARRGFKPDTRKLEMCMGDLKVELDLNRVRSKAEGKDEGGEKENENLF